MKNLSVKEAIKYYTLGFDILCVTKFVTSAITELEAGILVK